MNEDQNFDLRNALNAEKAQLMSSLSANIIGAGSTVVMQYDGSRYHIINIEAPIITTSKIDTLLAD